MGREERAIGVYSGELKDILALLVILCLMLIRFLSKKWIKLAMYWFKNKEKALYIALFTLNSHILVTFVIYSITNCNILCV